MKVLFMPLLQLPTGHQRVADALIDSLQRHLPFIMTKKIDFVNYVDSRLERGFTSLYLKWINYAPHSYDKLYRNLMYPTGSRRYFQIYEYLFLNKMEQLLKEEAPDLIVCTQAFPSFLISRLKHYHKVETPVVNVYTDFFINNLWGGEAIDYHFVPDLPLKHELLTQMGLHPSQVFATGIPIDEVFSTPRDRRCSPPSQVVIAGGNVGLGRMKELLKQIPEFSKLNFLILCGTNTRLFNELKSWNHPSILPIPYITSRAKMNTLYESADALITKPGGVTISEALAMKIPVFIHSELPGQEPLNREYLIKHNLVFPFNSEQSMEEQLINTLTDSQRMECWEKAVDTYLNRREVTGWGKLIDIVSEQSRNH